MEQPHARLNKAIAVILFLMTTGLSLLSQLPRILDSGLASILKLVWILPFSFLLFTSPHLFLSNKLQHFYFFTFVMVILAFACQMATGYKYFGPDINNFAIALLVTIVSYIFWKQYGSNYVMQNICIVVLICGTLLALQVYFDYLRDFDITEKSYAYDAKNSVGQILLCCATVIFMFYTPKDKRIKITSYLFAVVILIVMVETKSRATILSALYIAYYFTFKYVSKKIRIIIITLSIGAIAFIMLNETAYKIVMESIIYAGRDSSDINSLSSGRLLYFAIALKLIPQHPWFGSGDYYVDCMPLNILTEFGIVGITIVLTFLTFVFWQLWKKRKMDKIHTFTYVLFVSFLINSLLEAQPPFGPGMKCFIMWMYYGFTLANTTNNNDSLHSRSIAQVKKQ